MGINATPDDKRESPVAHAGRPLESASHFTRGGGPPAPDHDATDAHRRKRVESEQRRLIQWAKENRKLGGRLPPEFSRGGEHQVYFHRAKQRYLKATLLERQLGYGIALGSNCRGASPSEYLDRLDLQNLIFDDDIRRERVVLKNGQPVMSLPNLPLKAVHPPRPR